MTALDSRMTASETPGSASARVELVDVVKTYSGVRALDGISLDLEPGEFVALLGPSGCGKTTALRALAGLDVVDTGEIRIDHADVARTPTNRRDIGMVFQAYSLFPHLTVLANVEFGLRMRRVGAAERRSRADAALEMVGLAGFGARFAHQLSGGQQQRVALARALVTRPRVLLLDEPLSALDAKVRVQLREEIRRIQLDLGITTLFVTHDQEEALAIADRVAVMRSGRIEQIGSPEQLYTSPSTAFVADFVGLSNRVSGEITGSGVLVHGVELPVVDQMVDRGPVVALIRPEDLAFSASGLSAIVVSTSFLGSIRRSLVEIADGTRLSVQHEVSIHPQPGDRVFVSFSGRPVAVIDRA